MILRFVNSDELYRLGSRLLETLAVAEILLAGLQTYFIDPGRGHDHEAIRCDETQRESR